MIDLFDRTLEEVRPIANNAINEVAVYKDIKTGEKFVVSKLKERETTKKILKMLHDKAGNSLFPKELFVGSTVDKNSVLLLFHYIPERKLFSYLKSDSNSVHETISIIKDFIFKFMSLKIAPPLMQLLMNKSNINLGQDGHIQWGTLLNFEKINFEATEVDCARNCLDIVNSMVLEFDINGNKQYKSAKSIKLFLKKYKNNSYHSIIDVYNDFKTTGVIHAHFYDNWYAAFLAPSKMIKMAKISIIMIFCCIVFAGVYWLLEKSPFVIGFRNRSLDIIGTVDMTAEK
jgi:hypothetical protein